MKVNYFALSLISFFLSLVFYFLDNTYRYTFLFSIPSLIFFYFNRKSSKIGIDIIKRVFIVFIYMIITTALFFYLLDFFGLNDLSNVSSFIKSKSFLFILSAIFLAPLMEEMFFRGVLIEILSKFIKNKILLALIPSLVFSSLHFAYSSIAEILGVFIISLILSYEYAEKRNINIVILSHLFYNITSVVFYLFFYK